MVSGHKRVSGRKHRRKIVGKNIGRTVPIIVRNSQGPKEASGGTTKRRSGPGPKMSDIPPQVRQRVKAILKNHKKWGRQKHHVAAESLIKVCAENGIRLELITSLLLRRSSDAELKRAIVARLKTLRKK